MSSFISSPATLIERDTTIPPIEITATSVVPPPMSTIIEPTDSVTGSPAPIAAAIGSSTRPASRAPALTVASRTARFSTSVTPEGMPITTRGRAVPKARLPCTLPMKAWIISSVILKSEITPSCRGRTATIWDGVRPTISLASCPIALTELRRFDDISMATTDGSSMMTPRPFT